jgi:hypothetical protein
MAPPTKAVPKRRIEAGSGTGRKSAVSGELKVPSAPPPTEKLFIVTFQDPPGVSNVTGAEAAAEKTESYVGVIDQVALWVS